MRAGVGARDRRCGRTRASERTPVKARTPPTTVTDDHDERHSACEQEPRPGQAQAYTHTHTHARTHARTHTHKRWLDGRGDQPPPTQSRPPSESRSPSESRYRRSRLPRPIVSIIQYGRPASRDRRLRHRAGAQEVTISESCHIRVPKYPSLTISESLHIRVSLAATRARHLGSNSTTESSSGTCPLCPARPPLARDSPRIRHIPSRARHVPSSL